MFSSEVQIGSSKTVLQWDVPKFRTPKINRWPPDFRGLPSTFIPQEYSGLAPAVWVLPIDGLATALVAGYFHKKPQLIRFFQIDNKVYQNDGPFPWTYIQYKQNFDDLMRVPSCGNCHVAAVAFRLCLKSCLRLPWKVEHLMSASNTKRCGPAPGPT